ncbi:MAG: 3'-5' exoribonuclease YhaM family protein [Solirubrobacterales bacterium]
MNAQLGIEAVIEPNGNSAANRAEAASGGAELNGARVFVRDLTDGQAVTAAFVVRGRERRQKKDGTDWLQLMLADRTGRVSAKLWEGVDDVFELCAPGTILICEGRYSVHERYGASVTLKSVRVAGEAEFDHADLLDVAETPVDRLEDDMRRLISTVQNPSLRELLDRFLGEDSPRWPRFRDAPAAKHYHQAYRHGLLDHALSVAQAVSAAAAAFPGIDRDVAVTGALLHDIGKTEAYNDDPLAIDLTDDGRLLGEIPLGYYMIRREIESIEGFPTDLARSILHIILSHHGKLEQGSPVVPATREATLVHAIDSLGGTLGSFDRIERAMPAGEVWSGFDRGIGSSAYFLKRAA